MIVGGNLNDPVAVAFGKVLRRLRKDSPMSQEELGMAAGLQQRYISFLERGLYQPSITTVFQLAYALDMSPRQLVELVEAELGLSP